MSTEVQERVETDTRTELDDPIFAHIVQRSGNESGPAGVMRAMVEGTPITAICGYTWVPSRDPQKHPVCPKCLELLDMARDLAG